MLDSIRRSRASTMFEHCQVLYLQATTAGSNWESLQGHNVQKKKFHDWWFVNCCYRNIFRSFSLTVVLKKLNHFNRKAWRPDVWYDPGTPNKGRGRLSFIDVQLNFNIYGTFTTSRLSRFSIARGKIRDNTKIDIL